MEKVIAHAFVTKMRHSANKPGRDGQADGYDFSIRGLQAKPEHIIADTIIYREDKKAMI